MQNDKKDYLIELDRIVERQIKVYGDLLDRIAEEVRSEGLNKLADKIGILKVNYGLGKYIEGKESEFNLREPYNWEESYNRVLSIFSKEKGIQYKKSDIFTKLNGKLTEVMWNKVIRKLQRENKIKRVGLFYWME